MRIGLDFDGTIADASGGKMRYAAERWGVTLTRAQTMRPGAIPLLGRERYEQMIGDLFGSALTEEMEPMPGALDALRRLGAEHDLYVVTARLDHEVAFATQWLETHGVGIRELRNSARGRKAAPCAALQLAVMLEDSPAELAALPVAAPAAVLLATPYNAEDARADHWHEVPDWAAFETLCRRLASDGGRPALSAAPG